ARRPPNARGGARQFAARAGEASRRHRRRRNRRSQHSHRHAAGLRARRLAAARKTLLPRRSGRSRPAHRRRLGARQGQGLTRAFVLAFAAAAMLAQAATGERDLEQLRSRIQALQTDLEEKEAERREAHDALRDSERAISNANRTLAALQRESRELQADTPRLAAQLQGLELALAGRQAAVERVLLARQAFAAPDVLRAALSGDDPADFGRRLHYVGYVSRAAAALIAGYRADLEALARLEREVPAKRERQRP